MNMKRIWHWAFILNKNTGIFIKDILRVSAWDCGCNEIYVFSRYMAIKKSSLSKQTKINTIIINIQSFDISVIICKGFKHDDVKMLSVAVFLATQRSLGNKIFPGHRFSILVFISS